MVSGGNFVNIWDINGFFPFKGSFHYLFCHEFTLILKSKWKDLNSRLGGCGICVSEIYFSNFWKIKKKKTEVTLSLILRFNLRLGGLLHMEREYFAHHI